MATIVTRAGKGSPLTNAELDANFTNLNTELGAKLVSGDLSPYLLSSTANSTYATIANPSHTGNLTFTDTGNRIRGDFTNSTAANRVMFQTTTADSNTLVGIMPNGTATNSQLHVFNSSSPGTAAFGALIANSSVVQLQSTANGGGTILPLVAKVNTTEVWRASTGFNFLVGTQTDDGVNKLQVSGGAAVSGAVTGLTFNKLTLTAPATGSTLTIADGKTLTANSSLTLAGTDGKTLTVSKTMQLTAADDTGVYTFPTGTHTLVGQSSTDNLSNKTLTLPKFSISATVTAGTNAQGQGALTADVNLITTAASNPSGVTLPTAVAGLTVEVINKGANPVNVYPASGGSIDALAANAAISCAVGGVLLFTATSSTQWYSTANKTQAASQITGTLSVSQGGTGATTLTGLVKGNGTSAFTPAVAGTDYLALPSVAFLTPGTTVAQGTNPLTADRTIFSAYGPVGSSVTLPTPVAGKQVTLEFPYYGVDTTKVYVYPSSGCQIDDSGTDARIIIDLRYTNPARFYVTFTAINSTTWTSSLKTAIYPDSIQLTTGSGNVVRQTRPSISNPMLSFVQVTPGANSQGSASITTDYTILGGAVSAVCGATLPLLTSLNLKGASYTVRNNTAYTAYIYPNVGDHIDSLSANTPVSLPAGAQISFISDYTNTVWWSTKDTAITASRVEGQVSVAQGGTGATSITGMVKGNGTGAFTAAVAGTDYQSAQSVTGIVKSSGTTRSAAVAGTDYVAPGGNVATATTLSGDQTNWATNRSSAVANMLGWKNYGNGHVIFDASNNTAPTGASLGTSGVSNVNSATAWTTSYPTLMGWNGASTYGVRVDSCRLADNASGFPAVGLAEIGQYLDFHAAANGFDYDIRVSTVAGASVGAGWMGVYASGGFQVMGPLQATQLISGAGIIGYTTGAGGTAVQPTNIYTGVTINKPTGQITTFNNGGAAVSGQCVVTNAYANSNSIIYAFFNGSGTGANGDAVKVASVANGSFTLTFTTTGSGSATCTPVISFMVINGATS